MRVLTASQIRELDKFTIENEPIASYDLMERAARACFMHLPIDEDRTTIYICGKGNNGGDGLAMARLHAMEDEVVKVIVLEHIDEGTPDFARNLYRLSDETDVEVIHVKEIDDFPVIESEALVVDAILGTGLSRPLEGLIAEVVEKLNTLKNYVVSVDIPTGLFADDNTANSLEKVVRVNETLTFHCPKMSFLMPETGFLVGRFYVLDIGLMAKEMNPSSLIEYVEEQDVRLLHRTRTKFSHKGTYGHALMVAGSKGKMGAAQLASEATLRSGAGLVTAHVPSCGFDIMQIGVKEAMCSVDSNSDFITELPNLKPYNAIGVGPGIGTEKDAANALKRLIQDADARLVLDADALNILGENKTWLSFLPKGTILTPHPKEFERLVGRSSNSLDRLQIQKEFSVKYGVIVVLKGAHTCITLPSGQVFFNSTGNAGMATAGSGDVLTGVLTGLLAQDYSPEVAAVMGVYIHGLAGDYALEFQSEESLMAGNILDSLGNAFFELTI